MKTAGSRPAAALVLATLAALGLEATTATATEANAPAGSTTPGAATPGPGGGLIPKPSAPDLKPFTLEDRYFDAARRGDLAMLKLCIDKGVDPTIKDELGRSGLAMAVRDARSLELVEYLHGLGAPIDEADAVGRTPLHEAAGNGDRVMVGWLLEHDAAVGGRDMQGRTPLHNAVMGGSQRIAVLLLDAGADPDARDNFEDTPLIAACSKDLDEMARLLVDQGADPSLKDQEGRTAAERADAGSAYCRGLAEKEEPAAPAPAEATD